ncbi:MAG: DUF502 domain-containing protein [Proteobacteria bacterium]|nr:DUF502 domain-containing protein [Pseudomonadota bacterium]
MTAKKRVRTWVRDSFVAGLIAVAPLAVVWIVVDRLVFETNGVLGWLPEEWREARWTPPWADLPIPVLKTPGLGFALTLLLIVLLGWVARGLFGRRVVGKITEGFQAIPILGTIYSAVRQLLEAVFSSQAQQFQRVVMVQFPRKGCYVLGFVTARAWPGVETALGQAMVSVFVPTTPNPTSGFFAMFDEQEVIALNMTVEEAFKAIMSSGIVQPIDGGAMIGLDVGTMTVELEPVSVSD